MWFKSCQGAFFWVWVSFLRVFFLRRFFLYSKTLSSAFKISWVFFSLPSISFSLLRTSWCVIVSVFLNLGVWVKFIFSSFSFSPSSSFTQIPCFTYEFSTFTRCALLSWVIFITRTCCIGFWDSWGFLCPQPLVRTWGEACKSKWSFWAKWVSEGFRNCSGTHSLARCWIYRWDVRFCCSGLFWGVLEIVDALSHWVWVNDTFFWVSFCSRA